MAPSWDFVIKVLFQKVIAVGRFIFAINTERKNYGGWEDEHIQPSSFGRPTKLAGP